MKRTWKTAALVGLATVIVITMTGVTLAAGPLWKSTSDSPSPNGSAVSTARSTSVTASPLSDYEEEALEFMREEEKLARDVYLALYDDWGVEEFQTIAGSESRHMDSVARLLDRYGIADPVAENAPGVFVNPELQAAYDDLVAQGSLSVEDAYQVGVAIEVLDIEDLEALIGESTHQDISRVMQNLLNGSEHHLEAFTSLLEG